MWFLFKALPNKVPFTPGIESQLLTMIHKPYNLIPIISLTWSPTFAPPSTLTPNLSHEQVKHILISLFILITSSIIPWDMWNPSLSLALSLCYTSLTREVFTAHLV